MISIGVHRLFVVREPGVLGGELRLIQPQVNRLQRVRREVDDRRVHAQPVQRARSREREFAPPPVLLRTEPGTCRRPRVRLAGCRRPAQPLLRHTVGIGVVLLGRREHLPQIALGRVDLVDADEAVEEHPTVVMPRRDLRVERPPCTHRASAFHIHRLSDPWRSQRARVNSSASRTPSTRSSGRNRFGKRSCAGASATRTG